MPDMESIRRMLSGEAPPLPTPTPAMPPRITEDEEEDDLLTKLLRAVLGIRKPSGGEMGRAPGWGSNATDQADYLINGAPTPTPTPMPRRPY